MNWIHCYINRLQILYFLYSNDELTNLVGVRIFKDIWADSLTKTSFFDTIVAVQHSIYLVMIKEREWIKLRV